MKRILVACDPSRMDTPLRRSLAHLIKSCDISIVHNGYAAFDEIGIKPFDLIVVDFQLSGIDSLELVESLQYIDPGVPVILLIQESLKAIKGEAPRAKAQPILCPFNPLKFLRLVDKLLHQQLNRYRQLAGTLQTTLETLSRQTETASVFLVEENGEILLSFGEVEGELLERLGQLAVGVSMLDEELERLFSQDGKLRARYQSKKDHGLYVIPVSGNLRLALLSPLTNQAQTPEQLWSLLDKAATDVQLVFEQYSRQDSGDLETLRDHVFIPLSLYGATEPATEPVAVEEPLAGGEEKELAVNWEIISSTSNVLARLQNFIRS